MELNNIIVGSTSANYLTETHINKLEIVEQTPKLFTINNTAEKYYQWIDTALKLDDFSDLYIRFFKPHKIDENYELEAYKNISYIPLTKKYFYKFKNLSDFTTIDNYNTVTVTIEIFEYLYTSTMLKNYFSNIHIYDNEQTNSLSYISDITITFNFSHIVDTIITNETIESVIIDLITKMNCILFDDEIIYEKLKTNYNLDFYILKKIYGPITFKYNNLLFSENDKINKLYLTQIQTNKQTTNIINGICNHILYKDMVYFNDFKSGGYNDLYFLNYSNLLPATIIDTKIAGIANQYNNKNQLYSKFFIESFNTLNSLKFNTIFFDNTSDFGNIINFITPYILTNYTYTLTDNVVTLNLDNTSTLTPIKEFIITDIANQYKTTMASYSNLNYDIFNLNTIPNTILEIGNTINEEDTTFNSHNITNLSLSYMMFNVATTQDNLIIDFTDKDTTVAHIAGYGYSLPYMILFDLSNKFSDNYKTYSSGQTNTFSLSTLYKNMFQMYYPDYTTNLNMNNGESDTTFKQNIKSQHQISTSITNTNDEFTVSVSFKYTYGNTNGHFYIGDYIKLIDNNLYILNNYIDTVTNILPTTGNYIFIMRYNYGTITIDIIDSYLNKNTYNFTKNLADENIKLSHIEMCGNFETSNCYYNKIIIYNIDIKNRYIEDFLLYHNLDTAYKYGAGGPLIDLM